jgi:uncharacterized protein (TIGR03067 family)
MKPCCQLLPALGLLLAAAQADDEAVKKEVARLKGQWSVVEIISPDGQKAPPEVVKDRKMTIMDDKMSLTNKEKATNLGYKINLAKTPKEIDLVVLDGPVKGKMVKAIYSLEGETLKICLPDPDTDRPKDFTPNVKSGTGVLTLKKDK